MLFLALTSDAKGRKSSSVLRDEQTLSLVRQHHPPFEDRRKNDNTWTSSSIHPPFLGLQKRLTNGT